MPQYLACDLGADSGRVLLGTLEKGVLHTEDLHRFPTGGSRLLDSFHWDAPRFFTEIKAGLAQAAARGIRPAGISVDTWGVDYVLLRDRLPMLGLPYHYRDARNDTSYPETLQRLGRERIFGETGIQFMPFNTIFQLVAEQRDNPALLAAATSFLTMADYFNYLLCGVGRIEESMASTTQLYDPRTGAWSEALIAALALPRALFPPIVPSGTRLGPLLPAVSEETGLGPVDVIASCSHDTGAAVAAVPAEEGDDWAYLSSGTWSLLGVELPSPLFGPKALGRNFTNEIGFGRTVRFLKNIVGLWILQESRREWVRETGPVSWDDLAKEGEAAAPHAFLFNPNAARFLKPGQMPAKVRAYCRETGQPEPTGRGQLVRAIYESLAMFYRKTVEELEEVTGRKIRRIHIVGGGSRDTLLNQFTADACGRTVVAGPGEATAMGNLLIQAYATGELDSLAAIRRSVRASSQLTTFAPRDTAAWDAAYARFRQLTLAT